MGFHCVAHTQEAGGDKGFEPVSRTGEGCTLCLLSASSPPRTVGMVDLEGSPRRAHSPAPCTASKHTLSLLHLQDLLSCVLSDLSQRALSSVRSTKQALELHGASSELELSVVYLRSALLMVVPQGEWLYEACSLLPRRGSAEPRPRGCSGLGEPRPALPSF